MKIGAITASPERQFSEEDYSLSPASFRNISNSEKLLLTSTDMVLVHTTFSGEKEYILLIRRRGWDKGNRAFVESLLDKRCKILTAPPADSPHPDFP